MFFTGVNEIQWLNILHYYRFFRSSVDKRSPFSVDFMGMQVSYPQYLRLVALQEKVVQLDKLLRKMRQYKTEEELEKIPQWQR